MGKWSYNLLISLLSTSLTLGGSSKQVSSFNPFNEGELNIKNIELNSPNIPKFNNEVGGYALEELIGLALKNNPYLRAKEAKIDSAKEGLELTKSTWWPEFYLTGTFIDSGNSSFTKVGARVDWSININKLRKLDVSIAELNVLKQKEYLRREKVWTIAAVKELYYDMRADKEKIHIYDKYIDAFKKLSVDDSAKSNKRSKLFFYTQEREALKAHYIDLSNKLSLVALGNPFGENIKLDSNDFRYVPLHFTKQSVYREAINQRFVNELLDEQKLGILIKKSTQNYWPTLSAGYSQSKMFGSGAQGYDVNDKTFIINANWKINPSRKNHFKKQAIAEYEVHLYNTCGFIDQLVSDVTRVMDNLNFHYKILVSQEPVTYVFPEQANNGDIESLNQILKQDLNRIDSLNNYLHSLTTLDRYVLVSDEKEYENIGNPLRMPEILKVIFEKTDISQEKKDMYERILLE